MERTGNFPGKEARAVPNTRLDPRLAGYARAGWESVCREMQLPEGGFTERQAAQQRERYGANRPAAARRALGPRLRRAFLNPFSLTLLALCVLAWVTELLPGGGLAHEGTAPLMTGMLLLSGLVRLALEMRAHRQAQQLQRRTRLTVPVLREGRWQERDAEELVIGDRIRLRAGDPAPATVRLTRARDLFVSQSLLTGESAMTEKTPDPETDPAARPAAWRCLVWAGSTVVGGTGEGVVLALRPDAAPDEEPRRAGFDRGARSIAGVLLRFFGGADPGDLSAQRADQGAVGGRGGVRPVGGGGADPGTAAHGGDRLPDTRSRVPGHHHQGHRRHAGLWRHGPAVCGQDRHPDRRPHPAGILSGRAGQRERRRAGGRLAEQPLAHRGCATTWTRRCCGWPRPPAGRKNWPGWKRSIPAWTSCPLPTSGGWPACWCGTARAAACW